MEKKSYKITFNPDEKEQERCISFFERAPQRNKLVSFAITELINRYGLDELSETELKTFIKNYKAIARMGSFPDKRHINENGTLSEKNVTLLDKNGTFSQSDQSDHNGNTVTEIPVRQSHNGDTVAATSSQHKTEEIRQKAKENKNDDISNSSPALQNDDIEINMNAFNQMKNLMGAFS